MVLVKGDKHAAALAAAERGVPFVFVREVRDEGHAPETLGEVPRAFFELVSDWFCEPGEPPYPIGACLHYSL